MNTNKHIRGAHALVTGANRGIGLAFVEALLQCGADRVYAACRDPGARPALAALSDRVVPLVLDVTDADRIAELADAIPRLDLLLNNAGIATPMTFTDAAAHDVARREMATNYFGPLHLCNTLQEQLKRSGNAGIVNVSSIAALANFKALGPYSASKAAVHFLTQGLRAELRPFGVSVVGVYPGPVDTRLAAGAPGEKADPRRVADTVLTAYENGEEDVYPDGFSSAMQQLFQANPKDLERMFAA